MRPRTVLLLFLGLAYMTAAEAKPKAVARGPTQTGVSIQMDGRNIRAPAVRFGGQTLIRVRTIASQAGWLIHWEPATRVATLDIPSNRANPTALRPYSLDLARNSAPRYAEYRFGWFVARCRGVERRWDSLIFRGGSYVSMEGIRIATGWPVNTGPAAQMMVSIPRTNDEAQPQMFAARPVDDRPLANQLLDLVHAAYAARDRGYDSPRMSAGQARAMVRAAHDANYRREHQDAVQLAKMALKWFGDTEVRWDVNDDGTGEAASTKALLRTTAFEELLAGYRGAGDKNTASSLAMKLRDLDERRYPTASPKPAQSSNLEPRPLPEASTEPVPAADTPQVETGEAQPDAAESEPATPQEAPATEDESQ